MTTLKNEKIKLYAKQLRLPVFNEYDEVIRQLSNDASYEDFLIEIMSRELAERSSSGVQRRIKSAKFPVFKSIDEFDTERLECVSSAKITSLASCDFIKSKQNIVMIGNPGSGKTHLATALGINACRTGYKVKFYTAVNLAAELAEASQAARLTRLEKNLSSVDLLIVDELSYMTFNSKRQLIPCYTEYKNRALRVIIHLQDSIFRIYEIM